MTSSRTPVYLCYDERMILHRPVNWQPPDKFPESFRECQPGYVFENPRRLECIRERLRALEERLEEEQQQHQVFIPLECEAATRQEILLAHTDEEYYDRLADSENWTEEDCVAAGLADPDIYYCPESFQAARLACGGVLRCVDAVGGNSAADGDHNTTNRRAIALVRPPGHHACQSQSMGFCFLNSVAVAAKYALQSEKLCFDKKRVVILDWDIHHGNGTQDLTFDDPNIFYISLHRYTGRRKHNNNGFFPYTGHCSEVSESGTNLNVAWTAKGMRNVEYAAALSELILPLIISFNPGLVMVSCGFDAAANDLIGDCELTAPFYHAMTRSLLAAIGNDTPVVVALEGGYTMHVIAECMQAVSLALLDRDCRGDDIHQTDVSKEGSLEAARDALKDYWQRENYKECCKTLCPSAIRNINDSITAIETCPRWHNVTLQKLVKVSALSRSLRRTHRYKTRSSNNSKSKESKDDLDDTLQKLQSLSIGS